ncbi:DsbA family protein [Qipengyuania vesicularis]|uniref:DsbA family protein n=1 Tax=Qipengyuania vesicularis TaxID=2867232 RepID=UPI001C86A6A6|nr:DsbA family protein [Qipengyuania vesicularis]MBX7528166.1 DsbA family protein [Qipengyuania vesicularis]
MKLLVTALVALIAGFAGAAAFSFSGLGHQQTRDYLLENPEILPDLAEAYQAQQAKARLADVSGEIREPFAAGVLGNPQGTKTLVKFTDYGCGYCRQSVADVDRLIASDPDLKVVIREWPIFEGSEDAARMGLAAAAQGKYDAYYHAMFASGPPSAASVEAAARTAGLDMEAARSFSESAEVTAELMRNDAYARQLQFTGTPSWVLADRAVEGAVGYEDLAEMLAESDG